MRLDKIVEYFSEIDWPAIISAAAASKFGLVALALIIFGIVIIFLFRKSDDGKIRLIAFTLLLIGAGTLIYVVGDIAGHKASDIEKQKEQTAKLAACKTDGVLITHSCRAHDKSGFHSAPSAHCGLNINAGTGRFFADLTVVATKEHYRNLSGASAVQAVKPQMSSINGINVPIAFSGGIGCTNAAGTGRTCESKATITAVSFPTECVQFHKELRR